MVSCQAGGLALGRGVSPHGPVTVRSGHNLAERAVVMPLPEEIEAVLARVTSEEPDAASVLDDLAAERR